MNRKLRVLHIVSGDLWAGAEVQAFTLISQLARKPDVEVAAVLMNEGTLAQRLRAMHIPLCVIDEGHANSLHIFLRLRRMLKSWRPDVIHTHREKENILGSLGNLTWRKVPSVRTVHGAPEHGRFEFSRGARRCIISAVDRWCGQVLQERIIAVSADLGKRLAREFNQEKIVVIENGIDFEAVRAQRGVAEFRSANPQRRHIGIVGRLVKVKRIDLFLEAAALLQHERPQAGWQFHIFGDGPLRAELEKLAEQFGIVGCTKFYGHRNDIASCIGGLDALVICSDHEGMPMTALEAAALEVPMVCHAIGGLIELVPEALLVRRHDAQGYRDGILRALSQDARTIAREYIGNAIHQFSALRNAERVRAVYEQLLVGRYGA